MTRKPPERVRSIKGERLDRVTLTDADYLEALKAQRETLLAQGAEREILERLRSMLLSGAKDGGIKYYFDEELGIVRRREREETGS